MTKLYRITETGEKFYLMTVETVELAKEVIKYLEGTKIEMEEIKL